MEENNNNKKYPFEGNKWLKKNKYGKLEDIEDQCQNKTCTCSENECKYNDALWEEHYIACI